MIGLVTRKIMMGLVDNSCAFFSHFFFSDIILNFRTTFVSTSGQIVVTPRQIALNYCRGWFLLDLLAAIPFDLLYVFDINFVSKNSLVTFFFIFHKTFSVFFFPFFFASQKMIEAH